MKLVDQFLEGHRLLASSIDGLSPEQMKQTAEPGKWTIHENVIHVVDADLAYSERIKRVLAEEEPVLLPFDQDLWTARLDYHGRDIHAHIELFRLIRQTTAEMLQGLTAEQWLKAGKKGHEEMTVQQMVEALVGHVKGHVQAIEKARKRVE